MILVTVIMTSALLLVPLLIHTGWLCRKFCLCVCSKYKVLLGMRTHDLLS